MALLGLVCGLVAAAPMVLALRRGEVRLSWGMGTAALAFVLIQGSFMVVYRASPPDLPAFATLAVLAFLACVTTAALRRQQR